MVMSRYDAQRATVPRGLGWGRPVSHTAGRKAGAPRKPNASPLKPQNVISGTDLSSASVIYQKLSSDAAHPSITAFKQHFVDIAGTRGLSLKPRIKDGEVMNTAFLASMALLGGCIAANNAFGGTTVGERLEELVAEYHKITARTLPA
jgi:hypothetical protein